MPFGRMKYSEVCDCDKAKFLRTLDRIGHKQYHEIMYGNGTTSMRLAYQDRPIDWRSYFTWFNFFVIIVSLLFVFNTFSVITKESPGKPRKRELTQAAKTVAR